MNGAGGEGFKREYVDWWFEFLQAKGGKGVSKDTWNMVSISTAPSEPISLILVVQLFDFVRTIDSQFKNYDPEGMFLFIPIPSRRIF
jgi:DCN1-like protein 1/2